MPRVTYLTVLTTYIFFKIWNENILLSFIILSKSNYFFLTKSTVLPWPVLPGHLHIITRKVGFRIQSFFSCIMCGDFKHIILCQLPICVRLGRLGYISVSHRCVTLGCYLMSWRWCAYLVRLSMHGTGHWFPITSWFFKTTTKVDCMEKLFLI